MTLSHCVPTILHMLLSSPKAKEVNLKGWKLIIGGSALPVGLAKAALALGIDIFTGYGMSETCPLLTLAQIKPTFDEASADEQVALRCKTGVPIPLVDLRVVDGNMKDVAHDGKAVGEVVVRAPWLTQGYHKSAEASEQLWADGYLHTQDVGHIDKDGYLQITDRVKDVIKSGGEWVSSLEIETLISQHPAVSEVAVVGAKDEKWGERPVALVVAKPDRTVAEDEIIRHMKTFEASGRIPAYAVPKKVLLVKEIAKTSVGKIDKKLLRQQHAAALN